MPVTEQDALKAIEAFNVLGDQPELQAKAKLIHDTYRTEQESAGKPLFPEYQRQSVEQFQKIRKGFTDPDKYGFDDDQFRDFAQTFPDPEKRARYVNNQFLSRTFQRSTEDIRNGGTSYRDQYAKETWGEAVKSDEEFRQKLAGDFQTEDAIGDYAQKAALKGLTAQEAIATLPDEIKQSDSFKRQSAKFSKSVEDTAADTEMRISPYRETINNTVEDLKATMGVDGATGEISSFSDFANRLIEVPAEDRDLVLSAIIENGGDGEPNKKWTQKIAENFSRGSRDIVLDIPAFGSRAMLVNLKARAASGALVEGDPKTAEDYLRGLNSVATAALDSASMGTAIPSPTNAPNEKVKADALAMIEKGLDTIDLGARIREIADNDIDPASGEYMVTRGLYAAARSIPYTVLAIIPGGTIVNSAALAEQSYQTLRRSNPGMDRDKAMMFSVVAGPIMGALEKVPAAVLTGKLPTVGRFMNQAVATTGGAAARFAVRGVEGTAVEMVQENLQDFTPYAVQGVVAGLGADVPDIPWEKVYGGKFWEQQGELFFAVLPLAMFGAGAGSISDFNEARKLIASPDYVASLTGDTATATIISDLGKAGKYSEAQTLLRSELKRSGQDTKEIQKTRIEAAQSIQREAVAQKEAIEKGEDLGIIPIVTPKRNVKIGEDIFETAYLVRFNDKTERTFATYTEANEARWAHSGSRNIRFHEEVVSTISHADRTQREGQGTRYVMTGQDETLLKRVERGEVSREAALNRADTASDVDNQVFGAEEIRKLNVVNQTNEATTGMPNVSVSPLTQNSPGSPYYQASINIEGKDTAGHVSIKKLDDGTAVLSDIQIGYEGDVGRGKGHGTLAYAEIGKQLANIGITLQSTRWSKHQTSISPQSLKVWAKLEAMGLAKQTGSNESKVYDRQSGEDSVEVIPEYDFVPANTDGEVTAPETNAPLTKTSSDFKDPDSFYRVIVGDEAFNDIVDSGVVRTNARTKPPAFSGGEISLANRPTRWPSFSKGKASMSYAASNPNNYIVVSDDSSIQPSTKGKHGEGTTMFPTDQNGEAMESLDASKVDVYKHIGEGRYDLVYSKGKQVGQLTNEEIKAGIADEYDENFTASEIKALNEDDRLNSLIILGENTTEFENGLYITTAKLHNGATWATVIEEKLEGDVSVMIEKGRRDWLLKSLRSFEVLSGDRIFRADSEGQETDTDIKEAYARAGLAYFIGTEGEKDGFQQSAKFRKRYQGFVTAGLSGSMEGYARFFSSVAIRADSLQQMRKKGVLDPELERELARSTGYGEQAQYEDSVFEEVAANVEAMKASGFVATDDAPFSVISSSFDPAVDAAVKKLEADAEDSLRLRHAWLTPKGKWLNTAAHETVIPDEIRNHGNMWALGFVRVLKDGKTLFAEGAALNSRQARELKDTAIERSLTPDYDIRPKFAKFADEKFGGETSYSVLSNAQDTEYLNLAKDPEANREELQAMVDEAARAAGYDSPVLHHGSKESFDRFERSLSERPSGYFLRDQGLEAEYSGSFFLTESEVTASYYGTPRAFYVKSENPLRNVARPDSLGFKQDEFSEIQEKALRQGRDSVITEPLIDVPSKEADFLAEIMPVDKAVREEVLAKLLAPVWIVFNPNQIKSADPVTYDESGNVIPLSQRFNPARDEISYSVLSNVDQKISEIFTPYLRDPEQRFRIVQEVQKRSAEKGREWQPILNANRTNAEIEAERKTVENDLIGQKLETLSPSELGALEAQGVLNDNGMRPILSDLLREKFYKSKSGKSVRYWTGSLMSKSAAAREGIDTKGGEWDGIPEGLPPYVWGGSITPDQAATQFGFETQEEFWTALESEIVSFQNLKEDTQKAMSRIREIEKEAKAESKVWAEDQRKSKDTPLENLLTKRIDTVIKSGKNKGKPTTKMVGRLDFDKSPIGDIPAGFRGNEITPAEAAQSLGISEDEFWDRLRTHINLSDARTFGIDRATLIGAMRTLDAMISALPTELRGKIGGFTKLAQYTSPQALLNELERRSKKLDSVLSKYIKDEFRSRIGKILKKSEQSKKAGKKDFGGLGAMGHAWFDFAREVAGLGPIQLDATIAGLEEIVNKPDLTPAHFAEISAWVGEIITDEDTARDWYQERLDIAEIAGGTTWGNIDTGERERRNELSEEDFEAAHEFLKDAYTENRLNHLHNVALRRERWKGLRETMVSIVGGKANDPARIRQKDKDQKSLSRTLEGMFDEGLDFALFTEDVLGDSPIAKEVIEWARKADIAEKDAMKSRQIEFGDFIRALMPGKKLIARLSALDDLAQPRDVPGVEIKGHQAFMSELQAVHYLMLAEDPTSREWLDGEGYSDEVMEGLRRFVSSNAISVQSFLKNQYDEQYFKINAVYREIKGANLSRVQFYAPRLVEHTLTTKESVPGSDASREGGMSTGFTKRRVPVPKGEPVPTDALSVYWSNAFKVEHYIAFAEVVRDLRATLGHKDTRLSIEAHRGPAKANATQQWISDIDANGRKNAAANTFMARVLNRTATAFAQTALGYKLVTVVKQAPAMLASASHIGLKEYGVSLGNVLSGNAPVSIAEMYQTPLIQRRVNRGESEAKIAAKGGKKPTLSLPGKSHFYAEKGLDIGLEGLSEADAGFTSVSAAVAFDSHFRAAERAGFDTATAMQIAEDQTEDTIGRTAQPDSVINKSAFELSLGNGRLFFMFQGPSRQQFAIQYLAAKNVMRGKAEAKDYRTLANALFIHHFIVPSMVQATGNMMRYLMSDDDWDETWEAGDFVKAWILGPLTGALWMGTAFEALATYVGGVQKRFGGGPMDVAKDVFSGLESIFGGTDEVEFKDVMNFLNSISKAVGGDAAAIGVSVNILKQLLGIYDRVSDQD